MPKIYHVYCDESSQTQSRYMVFGGIVVAQDALPRFEDAMCAWRDRCRMHATAKWGKVSNEKYAEYRELADVFFALARADVAHFKAVIFDTSRVHHGVYNDGDGELGFYRFFYQFLLHKFGCYAGCDEDRLLVRLDRRMSRYKLSDLCRILNHGICKKYGRVAHVVPAVEAVETRGCNPMQMTDVLMGAVGFQNNQFHLRPEARKAKVDLAAYIARKAGLSTLRTETFRKPRFDLWQFRLRA